MQDSSWYPSWALSTHGSGSSEGPCSGPALTGQRKFHSLPWKHCEPPKIWGMRGKPWMPKPVSPSPVLLTSMCTFLVTLILKDSWRDIIPPPPKNEISKKYGNPVHNPGSYLCDICFIFPFRSHGRTQKVRNRLESTGTIWFLRKAISRNSVCSLKQSLLL